jgi:hypothetical protein
VQRRFFERDGNGGRGPANREAYGSARIERSGKNLIRPIPFVHNPSNCDAFAFGFLGFLKGLQVKALGAVGVELESGERQAGGVWIAALGGG